MYQTIHEAIAVIGVYANSKFKPIKFRWQGREFIVQQTCSVHDFKDGSVRKRRFSVIANHNTYLLEFNRDLESWYVEQVWLEG